MLHRKELTRSPIQHLLVLRKLVDGLLTRQLFDSLVFVFVPAGTSEQKSLLCYCKYNESLFFSIPYFVTGNPFADQPEKPSII